MEARPRILCLLPVRNEERNLREFLAYAASFCDSIAALDDGSTDGTRDLLETSSLVRLVLSNPRRETCAGWDDGANRNRLLSAAAELEPEWILSIDADERLDADDAATMRAFVESDAVPGLAYGFQHVRMWGADGCDPRISWVYRLFAFEPGQTFPEQRLHFDPVPVSIERKAWVRTSIRLQHLAAIDKERVRARSAKYREADPEREYRTDFAGLDRPPEGALVPWGPRDPAQPIILGAEEQGAAATGLLSSYVLDEEEGGIRPTLLCLLAARNCEEDLPGYIESVRRFADAVVALDDGSTDRTRALLEADPLVRVVLTKPVRPDYRGWDDASNRRMLLSAAGDLRPRWIISLDADERIDAPDAAALRAFVEDGAVPGRAYGFRVHRMIGDGGGYDLADLVVGRLFAYEPGQEFPAERLHFVPIPTSIPRERWIPTTIRIQHLAGSTEERRRARFQKYVEADPAREHQRTYRSLLEPAAGLMYWEPRPPGLPVVEDRPGVPPRSSTPADELALEDDELALDDVDIMGAEELEDLEALDGPVLSAIVIARDDEDRIERVVRSVVEQRCDEPFEIIVVTSGSDRTGAIVRERFPGVTLVELSHPALPGEARNAGLSVARGDYVSFPGSHVLLPQGSLAARIRAHELGYPMVTGSTLNGNPTSSGWASYFLDHSTVLPGRPSGELAAPPPHCSYDRQFLLEIGGFPEDMRAGEDTAVNLELCRRGYRPYRAQDVTLIHDSPCRGPLKLVRHHFSRGRALGRIMLAGRRPGARVLDRERVRRIVLGYLPIRMRATSANVERWGGELREVYRRVLPLVAAGAASAWAGTLFELSRPEPGKLRTLVGSPGLNVVLIGLDRKKGYPVGRADVLLVVRVNLGRAGASVVALPRDLLVDIPGRGPDLLNAAYFLGANRRGGEDPAGGIRLLSRTLERAVGVRIHGGVLVDFGGFRRIVDALGGVEVDVPHDIHDEFVGEDGELFSAHFDAGRQRLDGEAALTYARTRKTDGDVWRRRRHIDLALEIARGARRVRSPARLGALVRAARGSVRTTLGPAKAVALAQAAARLRGSRVRGAFVRPPLVKSERTFEGKWVHRGDRDTIAAFVRESLVRGIEEESEGSSPGRLRSR
jgi:LCP family protein required for cell wall assembly